MRRQAFTRAFVLIFGGVAMAAGCTGSFGKPGTSARIGSVLQGPEVVMEGLEIKEYQWDRLTYRARVEALEIQKLKLGPFSIGPLKGLFLRRVDVDLHTYTDGSMAHSFVGRPHGGVLEDHLRKPNDKSSDSELTEILPISQYKGIGSLQVDGFRASFYQDSHKLSVLKAEKLSLERGGEVHLEGNVSIHAVPDRTLRCKHLVWRYPDDRFHVEGSYHMERGQQAFRGEGVVMADFRLERCYVQGTKVRARKPSGLTGGAGMAVY